MFVTGKITDGLFVFDGAPIESGEKVITIEDEVMITLYPPDPTAGGWMTTYGLIGGNTWETLSCIWYQ